MHSLVWLDNNGKVTMGSRQVNMNPLTKHIQSIPPKKRVIPIPITIFTEIYLDNALKKKNMSPSIH